MNDKIVEMLGNNIPPGVVALACGVTQEYVTQLMADENIRAQVVSAKVANVETGVRVDNLIEDLEERALVRLGQVIDYASKPLELVRVFQTLNGAKKRTGELSGVNQNPTAALVQINISAEAAMLFKLSSDRQVVEVDGRSMATLPAKQLNQRLLEKQSRVPLISDATSAMQLLDRIEEGIPADSLAHVL